MDGGDVCMYSSLPFSLPARPRNGKFRSERYRTERQREDAEKRLRPISDEDHPAAVVFSLLLLSAL